MQVNKNKVITIPKKKNDSDLEFICPCTTCASKAMKQELQQVNILEIKKSIENILDSTVLHDADFRIDIHTDQHRSTMSEDLVKKGTPEISKTLAAIKAIVLFTAQFNKSYRHPLLCELDENAKAMLYNITLYSASYNKQFISSIQLWDLQSILAGLHTITQILKDIQKEELVNDARIVGLIKKLDDAKRHTGRKLRSMFISGIETDKVVPFGMQGDYQAEYGY